MKKLFLALIALNSTLALADSDMLLERVRAPHRGELGPTITTTLHEGGTLTETTCHKPRLACQTKELGRISATEEREVRDLIVLARQGKPKSGPPEFCEAIPQLDIIYRADEGRLVLSESSTPCGGHIFNDSEAAKELVQRLEAFAAR